MPKGNRISECELEIMKIVWQQKDKISSSQILQQVRCLDKWEDNTIYTMISRLVKKGFLQVEKVKKVSYYTPTLSQQDYQLTETQGFVNRLFNGNTSQLVSMLFESNRISKEDLAQLHRLWEEENE